MVAAYGHRPTHGTGPRALLATPSAALRHRRARAEEIHPDKRDANLYRWLLGHELFVRFQSGFELPSNYFTAYRGLADVA